MLKWNFVFIMLHKCITLSKQSISGVTYMDNFDFEERYRNVHECDPMYWHPLHLPDYCVNMYEKLIRSGLALKKPFTIVTHNTYEYKNEESESPKEERHHKKYKTLKYDLPSQEEYYPDIKVIDQGDDDSSVVYGKNIISSWYSPYEKMLEVLREDVANDPPKPTIEIIPNFGPVILYQQPISRKSEKVIKEIATAYNKANAELLEQGGDEYEVIAKKDGQDLLQKDPLSKKLKGDSKPSQPGKQKNKNNVKRKKIVKNNMVAIFEKKKFR